jgi:drug/metabolite transporter (DMT)-like permease
MNERARRAFTLASLGVLYTVWGSTYLAQRVAVATIPPLFMASIRFVLAGFSLYAIARALGAHAPTRKQLTRALISAVPLLVFGMGTASIAVKHVPSGLVALVFATVPIWTSLFGVAFGERPRAREVLGLALGVSGVALVASRGSLRADPTGLLLAGGAAASYALGCVATRRLPITSASTSSDDPRAAIATACLGPSLQMSIGGLLLGPYAYMNGERLTVMPTTASLIALAYLTVFGSILAYTALGFLLQNTRPALATSYAYVNPPVALALGAMFGAERFRGEDFGGLALVLFGVVMIATSRAQSAISSARPNGGVDLTLPGTTQRISRFLASLAGGNLPSRSVK